MTVLEIVVSAVTTVGDIDDVTDVDTERVINPVIIVGDPDAVIVYILVLD